MTEKLRDLTNEELENRHHYLMAEIANLREAKAEVQREVDRRVALRRRDSLKQQMKEIQAALDAGDDEEGGFALGSPLG